MLICLEIFLAFIDCVSWSLQYIIIL